MEAGSSSRDLLQRFALMSTVSGDPPPQAVSELSLGLSLGGCFSSNPREKTNLLIRSSSISSFPNLISSIVRGGDDDDDDDDGDKKDSVNLRAGDTTQLKRTCSMPVPGAEDYRKRKVLQALKRLEAKRKRHEKRISGSAGGGGLPPLSQGSSGSSSSSGAGGPTQGFEGTSKKLERRVSGTSELEMPCVTTRGSGLNGKRIEGFLYKYRRGEEVRIVCVCHGKFLTPAEFVRHAGGGDVDHPMRYIVVNTHPSP